MAGDDGRGMAGKEVMAGGGDADETGMQERTEERHEVVGEIGKGCWKGGVEETEKGCWKGTKKRWGRTRKGRKKVCKDRVGMEEGKDGGRDEK